MKYLIIDTETTGTDRTEARPVQLAWILASEMGETLIERSHIIIPEGFDIPPAATAIHGITTDRAIATGIEFNNLMYRFNNSVFLADVLIGHNLAYDFTVLKNELQSRGMSGHLTKLSEPIRFCTMDSTVGYCKLPAKDGKPGFKRPSLTELHTTLFGKPFGNAHDALADVQATARCFFELKKLGVI